MGNGRSYGVVNGHEEEVLREHRGTTRFVLRSEIKDQYRRWYACICDKCKHVIREDGYVVRSVKRPEFDPLSPIVYHVECAKILGLVAWRDDERQALVEYIEPLIPGLGDTVALVVWAEGGFTGRHTRGIVLGELDEGLY